MSCFRVGYSGKSAGNGSLGSWQNCLGRWSLSLSYVRFCHSEAMQSALSRTINGTPCSLRQAAVASPDGPAPTITGPFTQMQRREKKSSWSTRRNKFSILIQILVFFRFWVSFKYERVRIFDCLEVGSGFELEYGNLRVEVVLVIFFWKLKLKRSELRMNGDGGGCEALK